MSPVRERRRAFVRPRHGPRLYYEVGGRTEGPPIVLIRGLARSSSYWLEFRDLLEAERPVIVLDNRGVGRSGAPRPGYRTEDMADDVAAVLEASGAQRADVFGISLGGMIAQHVALRHPHRVRRLILAATSPGRRTGRPVAPDVALELVRSAALPFDEGIRRSAPLVLSPEHLRRSPETVELWVAIARAEPRQRLGVVGQMLAAARHEAGPRLRHVRAPTLVVTSDGDRLIPPDNGARLAARIPRATLHTVVGAGHDIPTERPAEMAELVLGFADE